MEYLNITIPEYQEMKVQLETAQQKMALYRSSRNLKNWKVCHREFSTLEEMLYWHRLLQIKFSYLANIEDFFRRPRKYKKEGINAAYLRGKAQEFYSSYGAILSDVAAFNDTIRRFMETFLSHTEHTSLSSYVEALHAFFHDERTSTSRSRLR